MSGDEWGVWSDLAGGFIDGPYYTKPEAVAAYHAQVANGEDGTDLTIVAWFDEDEDEDE